MEFSKCTKYKYIFAFVNVLYCIAIFFKNCQLRYPWKTIDSDLTNLEVGLKM